MEPCMDYDKIQDYLWNYFQFHAGNRLITFRFFLIICGFLIGGIITSIKLEFNQVISILLSILLSVFSFLFYKLDSRNRHLIKLSENALKYIEGKWRIEANRNESQSSTIAELPDFLKIFTFEERETEKIKKKKTWLFANKHLTFTSGFRAFFWIMGLLGILSAFLIYLNRSRPM